MRAQFTVDLRGIVDLLSHHLYSNPRVYLRELLQNAHDAIRTRAGSAGSDYTGKIEIRSAFGNSELVVRDNGIGLTADDMQSLLSMIGRSSKRGDLAEVRNDLLGQFGIGLLSAFLVADSVEVVSRSARTPDAPTVRWVGLSDGTFTIGNALEPLATPGTEVRLRPRHGAHRFCHSDACLRSARDFAEFLEVPVLVDGTLVSQTPPPWHLTTEQQIDWCQERFGFEAMGIIPIDNNASGVVGLAFVLPYTARPGYRTGDCIYAKGMLVTDTDDLVVPRWAFFCRAVIDAGELPLTASREGLQESPALQFVRNQIGFRLLSELIIVKGTDPDVYHDIVALHADGLKALAVLEPGVRDLLQASLHFETTQGRRTMESLLQDGGPLPYMTDAGSFDALRELAAHAGALVVRAGGPHEAELLQAVNGEHRDHFVEVQPSHVIGLVRLAAHHDERVTATLERKARRALPGTAVSLRVADFDPADRPVLWWPADAVDAAGTEPAPVGSTIVLNSTNSAVKRLLDAPEEADLAHALRALCVVGLLDSGVQPTVEHVAVLRDAVQHLVEAATPDG